MQLSPHFSEEELTLSSTALRHGIDNTPNAAQVANLTTLATTLLEPAHDMVGRLKIDSGYRCPAVNTLVRGSKNSAHMDGRAADCIPLDMPLKVAFDRIRLSTLPYDQIIIECGTWIHIGMAAEGQIPRRRAETGSWDDVAKEWVYTIVDDG